MIRFLLSHSLATLVPLLSLGVWLNTANATELTIKRDEYGTPHVYADDTYGLFYGYGYAIAQDRLYQLEMTRRSALGTVAEVLGPDYVDFDIGVRKNYSPASIRRQLAQLPQEDLDILQGYADGLNRWIVSISAHPETLQPKEFLTNDFTPQPWSAFDVAMVFIGTMVNRFGDYNSEIQNQQLLNALVAQHGETQGQALFNTLVAFYDSAAPTTVPKGEWDPQIRADAFLSAPVTSNNEPLPPDSGKPQPIPGVAEQPFSNIIVLGREKTRNARSVLINGPQFGYYQPAYTYSIGLHGAGYDAVGNSPFGYPLVEFGYNADISWGSTWGAADNVDLFRLELNPGNPEQYRYKDGYENLESRMERIDIRGEESREIKVYRSRYGAVVDYRPKDGVAYAKHRGWEGQEVATLMAWNKVAKAQDHQAWLDQVRHSAINVNWYYADNDGNIAYALGGRYPKRATGQDGRLPTPGNGEYDWRGFMPFETNPQVLNPETGYIANWNQRPAEGLPNPDMWWYGWHAADRIETLFTRLNSQSRFTPDEAWQLMMDAAFEDSSARFFVPRLLEAISEKDSERIQEAATLLATWDYMERDQDEDGFYDSPAIPLYRSWLNHMLALTYEELLPKEQASWFIQSGHLEPGGTTPGSVNIAIGSKVMHRALSSHPGNATEFDLFVGRDANELMRQALAETLDELTTAKGSAISSWRTKVSHTLYSHRNFLDIPQTLKSAEMRNHLAMNRGTENNMTVFTANNVIGYEVAPPGQSGFIAPDGSRTAHFDDQLAMFGQLKKKHTWLEVQDIASNAASTKTLVY